MLYIEYQVLTNLGGAHLWPHINQIIFVAEHVVWECHAPRSAKSNGLELAFCESTPLP